MERHRPRQQNRERRSQCRGGEFGALMNALGLVPDDDIPGNARDSSSGISRMREVGCLSVQSVKAECFVRLCSEL